MKHKLSIIFILLIFNVFGQLSFNYTRNLDLYKPYTETTQEYMKYNDQISSSTRSANVKYTAFSNGKISWNVGVCYKYIKHLIDHKVLGYYEHYVSPSMGLDYYIFRETDLDLWSKSHSLGIVNELDYTFFETDKLINKVGISNEIYLFENYSSVYVFHKKHVNFNDEVFDVNLYPLNSNFGKNGNKLFLSSTNLSIYYRFEGKIADDFRFGTKISLGTNLYSDWDQFRKYIWIGVGLEVGFGGRKKEKGNDTPE